MWDQLLISYITLDYKFYNNGLLLIAIIIVKTIVNSYWVFSAGQHCINGVHELSYNHPNSLFMLSLFMEEEIMLLKVKVTCPNPFTYTLLKQEF